MTRSLPEWVGKTHDSPIPPRVKLRIFERDKGRCHISGRLIRAGEAWDADHIVALCNGGEHKESNLAPALAKPHRAKTAEDVAEKATVYRKRAKHLGVAPKRKSFQSRPFAKPEAQRSASRPIQRKSEALAIALHDGDTNVG